MLVFLLALGLGLVVEPAPRVVANTVVSQRLCQLKGHTRAAATPAVENNLVVLGGLVEAYERTEEYMAG